MALTEEPLTQEPRRQDNTDNSPDRIPTGPEDKMISALYRLQFQEAEHLTAEQKAQGLVARFFREPEEFMPQLNLQISKNGTSFSAVLTSEPYEITWHFEVNGTAEEIAPIIEERLNGKKESAMNAIRESFQDAIAETSVLKGFKTE